MFVQLEINSDLFRLFRSLSKYSGEKMKFVDKKNCVICRLEVCRRKALVDHIDLSVIVTQALMHQRILIIKIQEHHHHFDWLFEQQHSRVIQNI